MSLINQFGALGQNASSEYEYRRMMDDLLRQQMVQQQYMAPPSLSAGMRPAEPSPVLLLLPRKAA